jgi:DNA-binding CsgD family transcriptional regulator
MEFRVRAGMQFWEDTFKKYTDASNYMSLCRDFLVDKGYSFGFVSNGITCLLDFASPIMKRSQYTETILKYITPHFDQALRRLFLQNSTKIILTPREQEILKWISSGKQNWDISVILSISIETIKFHVKNIYKKLGATNRAEAVAMAIQNNLIRLETCNIQAFVKESARS